MIMRDQEPSPLVAAAEGLEAQLEHLEAIVAAARREPLNSQKHLQRAATTLNGVTQLEGKLREALARLVDAIGQAGGRQQTAMEELGQCAQVLEKRLGEFQELIARRDQFGAEAARVNNSIKTLLERGDLSSAVPQAISELAHVAAAGKELFAVAKERGFNDIAREADSVQQQLLGLRKKLMQLAPEHDVGDNLQVDLEVPDEDELSRARLEEAQRAAEDEGGAPA